MKQRFYLDFEEAIGKLEERIGSMRTLARENGVDVSKAVKALEKKVKQLTEETFNQLTRWQRVQLSRHPERPYSMDYIQGLCAPFVELHGDRLYGDDKAVVGGFGRLDGQTYMFIGQQKGRNTKDRQYRNFGMSHPEGYRKALRLMKLAEKFNKPIITLIDTPGAYPGIGAEERGQGQAIAYNMQEMLKLRVPVICVIIGEGASGGAIAIGIGDRVLMMENTWYSVISPESCSSILWRSWQYKEQAAEALKLTAEDMLKNKLIDGIISEPCGGAHKDPSGAILLLRKALLKEMKGLLKHSPEARIEMRIEKFGAMGRYKEKSPKRVSAPAKKTAKKTTNS